MGWEFDPGFWFSLRDSWSAAMGLMAVGMSLGFMAGVWRRNDPVAATMSVRARTEDRR